MLKKQGIILGSRGKAPISLSAGAVFLFTEEVGVTEPCGLIVKVVMLKPYKTPGGGTNESKVFGISVLICTDGQGSYTDDQLYKGSYMETI